MSFEWTEEKLLEFKELFPQLGSTATADALGIPLQVVIYKARVLGLRFLPKRERPCSMCKSALQSDKVKSKTCEPCHKINIRKYNKSRTELDLRETFMHHLRRMKWRNKQRHGSPATDITVETLFNLFESQNGLCYYTDRELMLSSGEARSHSIISVDRLDSTKPYTMDNIVFCTWGVNLAKNEIHRDDFVAMCREVAAKHG